MSALVDGVMDSFIRTLTNLKSKARNGEYSFFDMVGAREYLIAQVEKAVVRVDSLEQRCTTLGDLEQLDDCKAIFKELRTVAENLLATPSDEQFRPQVIPSEILFEGVRKELVWKVVSAYEKCSLDTIMGVALEAKEKHQLSRSAFKQLIGYLLHKNEIPKDQAIAFIEQHKLADCSSRGAFASTVTRWRREFEKNYPEIVSIFEEKNI